jgi:hypothetical protein
MGPAPVQKRIGVLGLKRGDLFEVPERKKVLSGEKFQIACKPTPRQRRSGMPARSIRRSQQAPCDRRTCALRTPGRRWWWLRRALI